MFDQGDFEVEFGDEIFCHYAGDGEPCWGGVVIRDTNGLPSKVGVSRIPTCVGHTPLIWGGPYVLETELRGGHLRLHHPKFFGGDPPRDPELVSLENTWSFDANGVTEADVDLEEVGRMLTR